MGASSSGDNTEALLVIHPDDGRKITEGCWHPHCDDCPHIRGDPYAFVASANIHRRHLTSDQKRDLIANLLRARPERSNLATAKIAHADDKTVATVRR